MASCQNHKDNGIYSTCLVQVAINFTNGGVHLLYFSFECVGNEEQSELLYVEINLNNIKS